MKRMLSWIALSVLTCATASAQQAAPRLLPFQARLTDQAGVAVANGARLVQFKIYGVPNAGAPVWAGEIHKTTVNGGLINVLLGSKTTLAGVDFDQTLYLEVTADIDQDNAITAADPPMLPRQVILPAVFAKESADSRKLAGYDWSAILAPGSADPLSGKIDGGKLVNITSNSIAVGTIHGRLLADGSVASNHISAGAIGPSQLSEALAALLRSASPPGTIVAFGGTTPPSGWLLCDGRALRSREYPHLYGAISTNWGGGYRRRGEDWFREDEDFNLPDLRGVFLRGVTGGRTNAFSDPDAAARTAAVPGGASGNQVGSVQMDDFKSHNHNLRVNYGPGELPRDWAYFYSAGNTAYGYSDSAGGSETRPRNTYVNYIIRY